MTAMCRVFKAMDLLCFIWDVEYRNFVVEHELDVVEAQYRKENFVLADKPYNK